MKIKVTYEKVYDSGEFYSGWDPEELEDLTVNQFLDDIKDEMADYPYDVLDSMVYTTVNEG